MPQRNITSRYSGLEGASYNVVEEKIFLCRRQVPMAALSTAVGGDNWFDFSANAAVPPRHTDIVKPLWHIMIATSVLMYTQNYLFNKGTHIQHARQEKKVALEEYYKNHNITPHH
eukprot:scaffold3570_cov138-Skeletonema_menzelii.AAC.3